MHKTEAERTRRLLLHVENLREQLRRQVEEMEAAPIVTLSDIELLEAMEDEVRLRAEEACLAGGVGFPAASRAFPAAAQ